MQDSDDEDECTDDSVYLQRHQRQLECMAKSQINSSTSFKCLKDIGVKEDDNSKYNKTCGEVTENNI